MRYSNTLADETLGRETKPEIGCAFRPLVVCCLPNRLPDAHSREWMRESPSLQVRVAVHAGQLPHGQDRLVLLLLATAALHQDSRTVSLGPAYSILKRFGLTANGRDYQRLAERFRRVLDISIEVRPTLNQQPPQRYGVFEKRRMWFETDPAGVGERRFDNVVTLSEGFWTEVRAHPILFPFEAVRSLMGSPGSLDLYLWLVYRASRVRQGRFAKIRLFGPGGMASHLGSTDYAQARDFRNQLKSWLARIREAWPECPALFSSTGNELLVWRRDMIQLPKAHAASAGHVQQLSADHH